MAKVTFVIGANASGKTYFIEQHYKNQDVVILNIYDYQQREYDAEGFGDWIPLHAQFTCLKKANETLLEDAIAYVIQGKDVVVEQTFFRAKRRIAYIDVIRKTTDATIEVYVMRPSGSLWQENVDKRKLERTLESIKDEASQFEFPNPAEGFDMIYEVVDGESRVVMNPFKPEIVEIAHRELAEEERQIKEEELEKQKRTELLQSMDTRKFWHYCEVCGKKLLITAQEAYDTGWDYPPQIGKFGLLGPRTCGECPVNQTLYWKVQKEMPIPLVVESTLTKEELITWKRIKGEPESLIKEEEVL